jgi:hypothetical protein
MWWRRRRRTCQAKQEDILNDIAPLLMDSNSDAVMKYTMCKGGAGIDREAYYTG